MRLLIAAAFLVVASVTTVNAQPYDLRGFRLGMTLDEFKAMRHPDANEIPGIELHCTGDNLPNKGTVNLRVYGIDAALGIIRCNHFRPNVIKELAKMGHLDEVNLNVSGIGVYQIFEFIPNPENGIPLLFRITIKSNMDYWSQFFSAYTEKYGKPTSLTTEKVQNGVGATFDKITAVWANKESSILLEQRATQINLIRIVYQESALSAYVKKKTEAIEGKPSDKL